MSDQHLWPATGDVLGELAQIRDCVAGVAHQLGGDDLKPMQAALVAAVGRLDELAASVQARLSVPTVLREPVAEWPAVQEPGQVTADVVRRMRKNAGGPGKHRPKYKAPR